MVRVAVWTRVGVAVRAGAQAVRKKMENKIKKIWRMEVILNNKILISRPDRFSHNAKYSSGRNFTTKIRSGRTRKPVRSGVALLQISPNYKPPARC